MRRRIDPRAARVISVLVIILTTMAWAVVLVLPAFVASVIVGVMGYSVALFLWATAALTSINGTTGGE